MKCEDCRRAKVDLAWFQFNPACRICGGRVLWFLQRMRIPQGEKVARLRGNLAHWMEYGHPEQELRWLAEQDWRRWSNDLPWL
jgi:hypothetical protein